MLQYNMTIAYIKGEDNTVANALSCLPQGVFADKRKPGSTAPHTAWAKVNTVGMVLTSVADSSILNDIKNGHRTDRFCKKFFDPNFGTPGICKVSGLWYAGSQLIIPCTGDIWEQLFHLAHDTLGHFGSDKSYASLQDMYYWPNMRRDLEEAYILACMDCQQNKLQMTKAAGLLHPLPIPKGCGESVAMDFIRPLPP
jgi:hypothetical protein